MAYFWKTVALIVIGVILWVVVDKKEKDISTLLTLAVCCAAATAAAAYLQPVIALVQELKVLGQLEDSLLQILLKAVGIGLVSEITGMICADAGNSSMAGTVRFLGSAVILYVSVPVLRTLMELIQEILGVL